MQAGGTVASEAVVKGALLPLPHLWSLGREWLGVRGAGEQAASGGAGGAAQSVSKRGTTRQRAPGVCAIRSCECLSSLLRLYDAASRGVQAGWPSQRAS